MAVAGIAAAVALLACSRNASAPPAPPASDDASSQGCNPGELTLEDGTCQPAGIPPEMCGAGFKADGNMGCDPILPPKPCPKGQMAVPGETQCRDVAPCADGNWGDIPVEANTQFVDASYAGGGSDGSQGRPWTKIGDAVNAAAPGAIVALAAGSYREDVTIQGKAVRLWGRCPGLTEIMGTGQHPRAAFIEDGATGTEIHGLAVRGDAAGVWLSGSRGVVLDRIWVHDTAGHGISVRGTLGATSVTVSRSLIEDANEIGILVVGSNATMAGTVVRDTQPRASDQHGGDGIAIQDDPQTLARATATVRASVVERNRTFGVSVEGSDGTIEESVVRDTQPRVSDQQGGFGILVADNQQTRARASAALRASVVERNHGVGVWVGGADVTIEASVVGGTEPQASDQAGGNGIAIQADPQTHARARATVRACLVENNRTAGLSLSDSEATIDALLVRSTQPRLSDAAFGDGIAVVTEQAGGSAIITGSRVETSARTGLSSFGAQVTLSSTAFECNTIDLDGEPNGGVDFSFDVSGGGNACGCSGNGVQCQVLSTGLQPPKPVQPPQ